MDGLLGIINADKPIDNGPLRPLAVRMRPKTLDEVLGQDEALASGSPLRIIAEQPNSTSVVAPASIILYGTPGVGKTTIAHIIAIQSGRQLVELSATSASVKDVKSEIEKAKSRYASTGVETILFLDEIHRFSKSQQDSLLPAVENRDVTLIAATTENPSFSVIRPLLSRSIVIALKAIDDESMMRLLKNAVRSSDGLDSRVSVRKDAANEIVGLCSGDARSALTTLEAATAIAMSRSRSTGNGDKKPVVTINDVETVMKAGGKSYDRSGDDHYDMASAFIKSMRGSDPDAAIYWAARMLRYGEDPRFIARRVMIAAAEEVGLADPQVLQTAVAAAQAIDMLGMPEGRIPLAEAIVAVATAPKSNRAYLAMDRAIADVDNGAIGPVPIHLRNATSKDKKDAGYGEGYNYAHDWPHGVAPQQYLPDGMDDVEYYSPTTRGHEKEINSRMEKVRAILHESGNELAVDDHNERVTDSMARDDHERRLWAEGRKIVRPEPKPL